MKSPAISLVLLMALIALIGYQAHEIINLVNKVNTTAQVKPQPKPKKQQQPAPQPVNLEAKCQQLHNKAEKCLDEAQACVAVLNGFTEKNKKFEKKVQQCQDRNIKNSVRNEKLKKRLDQIHSRTQKQKNQQQAMEL